VFGWYGTREPPEPLQNFQRFEYYQANYKDRSSAFIHITMPSKIFVFPDCRKKKHDMTYCM
jgi:hypothetical protein